MTDSNSYPQEVIDDILDAHGVECIDDLPRPVQNNIRRGPNAEIDPFARLRRDE